MKIELEGYYLDELIKLLYRKKIPLYNVQRQDDSHISFETEDKYNKKIKHYILNYKAKITLSKIKQMPKFLLANLGIILGVFFGSFIFIFLSNFTWQIKVYGTEDLTTEEIISVLAENNVKVGKINTITTDEIESILLNNYDRIAQVSVIKQGTTIIINLSEKLVYEEVEYEPIVAKFAGIITEVNILTGTTNVKVGDYVNIGDVLVLPFYVNSDGEQVAVEPLAEIKAKIFIIGSCSISETEMVLQRTGNVIVEYKYQLFNSNIFSGRNKNSFAFFESLEYTKYISDLIPLKRTKIVYYELALVEVTHDFASEQEQLIEKAYNLALEKLPSNYQLLDETSSVTIVENKMYATTTLTIIGVIN